MASSSKSKASVWHGYLMAGDRSSPVLRDTRLDTNNPKTFYMYNLKRGEILEYAREIVEKKLRELKPGESGFIAELDVGYKKARIIEDDRNEIRAMSLSRRYNIAVRECKRILADCRTVKDLNKVIAAMDIAEASGAIKFQKETKEAVLNVISELSAGEINIAMQDIKKIDASLVEQVEEDITDALYYLTYWNNPGDLRKASKIMKTAGLETVDLDLSISYLSEEDEDKKLANYERALLGIDSALKSAEGKASEDWILD